MKPEIFSPFSGTVGMGTVGRARGAVVPTKISGKFWSMSVARYRMRLLVQWLLFKYLLEYQRSSTQSLQINQSQ